MRLGQIAVGILSFSRDKDKKYEFHVGIGSSPVLTIIKLKEGDSSSELESGFKQIYRDKK